MISGGFPCQDISIGGKRKGIGGSRSSLWKEYWRLINEVKPRYAIIENVERLRKDGLGVVLRDLYKIGYNAEWHCIRARAVGHLHQRDRIWIIAYRSEQRSHECNGKERHLQINKNRKSEKVLYERKECQLEPGEICTILSRRALESIKDAYSSKLSIVSEIRRVTDGIAYKMDFDTKARKTDSERLKEIRAIVKRIEYRRTESIKQVGNAVVPQIPELIGKAIVDYENNKRIQE